MKYTKKWMVVPYQEKQQPQHHVEPQNKLDLNLQNILKRKNLPKDVKVKIHNHLLGMKVQKPNFFQKEDEPQIEIPIETTPVFNEPTYQDTTMIDVDDAEIVEDENELNKSIENAYNFLNRSLKNLLPKVLLENPEILMDALNSGANLTRFKLSAKRKLLKEKNEKSDSPVTKQDKILKTPSLSNRLSSLAQPKTITPKVTPSSNITQRKSKSTNNKFENWTLLNERK